MGETVKSAVRVLQVFEYFKDVRRPARLKEIVARLGAPTSSTAAILKCLQDEGYLQFDQGSRCYFPTPRVSQLASWIPPATFEQDIVHDALRRLQKSTGELIVLGTPNGIHMEYVETLRSTQGIQLYAAPGTRRLMVQTGMGWLLLSRMPESAALSVYRKAVARGEIAESEFPPEALRARLDEMRRRDHSFTHAAEYVRPTAHWGGAMIAMLVPVPAGHRKLTVGIGGPGERLKQNYDAILTALRAEIAGIAAAVPAAPDPIASASPPHPHQGDPR
jgi:DNA-binding IclR family transcriptional regulator